MRVAVQRRGLATPAGGQGRTVPPARGPAASQSRLTDDRKAELFQRFLESKRKQMGAGGAVPPGAASPRPSSARTPPPAGSARPSAPPRHPLDDLFGSAAKGGMPDFSKMAGAGLGGAGGQPLDEGRMAALEKEPEFKKMMSMIGGPKGMQSMMQEMQQMMGGGKDGMDIQQLMSQMMGGPTNEAAAEKAAQAEAFALRKKGTTKSQGADNAVDVQEQIKKLRQELAGSTDERQAMQNLNAQSETALNALRKKVGGKTDPLAALARGAAKGDDPGGLLGAEPKTVKSPAEAVEAVRAQRALQEELAKKREELKKTSISSAQLPPQLQQHLERLQQRRAFNAGVSNDADDDDNRPRFTPPLSPSQAKPLKPAELPTRFGPRKLASDAAKTLSEKQQQKHYTMPPLPSMQEDEWIPESSTRDPRLAFKTRSAEAKPAAEVKRGDQVLKPEALLSKELERFIAQQASKLEGNKKDEEDLAPEEEEEDVSNQPWVINESDVLLPDDEPQEEVAKADELLENEFLNRSLSEEEKKVLEEQEEAKAKREAAKAAKMGKVVDVKADEGKEEDEDVDIEFDEEDYMRRTPKTQQEAEELAAYKAHQTPEHVARRRAQVRKAAERYLKETSPWDETGNLRWTDELDETNDIVQECIQRLQEEVEIGPTEALEVFNTYEFEGQLAVVALWAFEQRIPHCFILFQKFYERFPDSIYPVRALMASLMLPAAREKVDAETAATISRLHLAATFVRGIFEKYRTADTPAITLRDRLLREGIDRAAMVLAQFYAVIGARSFAKSVLDYFGEFPLSKDVKTAHVEMKSKLDDELQQRPDLQALDQKWEEFHRSGKHAKFLNNLCIRDSLVQTAIRIKVHAKNFEQQPGYKVDLSDIWLDIWTDGSDEEGEGDYRLRSLLDPLKPEESSEIVARTLSGKM